MTFDTVDARGLTKVYGRQRALAGVDLTLRAGEATALLGPNGAGKSTLVRILATLVSPTAGSVRYGASGGGAASVASNDTQLADDELRGAIGVIAHESHCYGDLTGHENLVFFARLYAVADARAAAAALLARVGLRDAAHRPARTYSRGMLQRLAVARALVHKPRLLLADEPFTGLDRAGVALLSELLAEERARGCIMVVVTHDFDAVAPLIDRVVVLARGRIAHDAAAPASRSTAALADVYRAAVHSSVQQ
jgi:heme exporter protein A